MICPDCGGRKYRRNASLKAPFQWMNRYDNLGQYTYPSPWGLQSLTPDDVARCEKKPLSTEDAIFCEILPIRKPYRIPRTEWILHLTGYSKPWSWSHFTHGRSLENLYGGQAGAKGWGTLQGRETDCNLPPDERDIRIQFGWPTTSIIFGWQSWYKSELKGKTSYLLGDEPGYALLFQVKTGAVMQRGPEGFEAVFRICDEINTIPLMAAFQDYTLYDGTHFTSLVDLVEYANDSIGVDTTWAALPPKYWTSHKDMEIYKEVAGGHQRIFIKDLEEEDYDFRRIARMLVRGTS